MGSMKLDEFPSASCVTISFLRTLLQQVAMIVFSLSACDLK